MTIEQAREVHAWCVANDLHRPDILETPIDTALRWRFGAASEHVFATTLYRSARRWCAIMLEEHAAGVPGYWTPKR